MTDGETPYLANNSTEYGDSANIVAGGASDHHSDIIVMLTYVFYALMLAAIVQFLIKRLPSCIRPPYAMTLFALGAFLSYLHHTQPSTGWALFSHSIGVVENINPEVVFFVILPPLLYESGSGLNWHVFRRLMWSAFILAFPGVVLNLFFIGIFAWVAFGQGWTLPVSFLLGSMLSTTDPVAVVAALHNLHAPDKLALLIDGESLLNDGSAIVGVLIFQNMIETGEFSFLSILDLLFRCAGGGCLFGVLFASAEVVFLKLINKFDHSAPALEVAVVVVGMFLCYLIGDLLHMSGIIAVVSLAISMAVIGRGSFSPEGEEAVHTVVRQLAYFANQLIWLAGGHMTAAQLSQSDVASDPINWIRMVALFLMLNIARGISTWIMFPTLTRMGYGLNLKETILLVYAGLRGGICIALVLLIRRSSYIPETTLNEMGFYVAGAVMLTLMVNGTTIEAVYRWLQIYPKRTWAQIQLQRALSQVDAREAKFVESLKQHWFFKNLNLPLINKMLPQFSKAEFNVQTGEVHVPMDSVKNIMREVMDRFDSVGPSHLEETKLKISSSDDNGFMYSALSVKAGDNPSLPSASMFRTNSQADLTTRSKASSTDSHEEALRARREGTDRLIRVVQLSDTRIKAAEASHHQSSTAAIGSQVRSLAANIIGKKSAAAVGKAEPPLALFQCNRPISDFVIKRLDESSNPFADSSKPRTESVVMEFSISLPDTGIEKDLMGLAPSIVIGLSPWLEDSMPGEVSLSCGLSTESKQLFVGGQAVSSVSQSEFRREFVRGDSITVCAELVSEQGKNPAVKVSFMCGRYLVGDCEIENGDIAQLHPTIGFLVPEEQVELSFALRTTTTAETRTESYAYILNAAICLYEDLFKGGTLSAQSLRVLCDSVQYGIDAANDDLEVRSMQKRVKTVKDIYTKGKSKYESMDEHSGSENGDASIEEKLSPLETEWGFLQLRHLKRLDCNDEGIIGFFLRVGEFLGIRSQYRQTYRKIEELLAYGSVHADLVSHVEMARFPETLQLVSRLVLVSKSHLMEEVRRSSPRDFYIAQHVLAAKILLNIRRKVLSEFTKEGSLGIHSVEEMDEHYIKKQLLDLEDFAPSRPKGSSIFSPITKLPRTQTGPVSQLAPPSIVELRKVVTKQQSE